MLDILGQNEEPFSQSSYIFMLPFKLVNFVMVIC